MRSFLSVTLRARWSPVLALAHPLPRPFCRNINSEMLEDSMRFAATPLQILVAAIPNAALRPLLIELLQNGAMPTAPLAPDAAETTTSPAARRGWPRGKPRGRKAHRRKAAAGETEFARTERLALKAAAQRQRDSEKRRQKRAAAQ